VNNMNGLTEQEKNIFILAMAEVARTSRTMQWDYHGIESVACDTTDEVFESPRVKNNELVVITNISGGTSDVNTSSVYFEVYDGVTAKPIYRASQATDLVYVNWAGQVILYEGQSLRAHVLATTAAGDTCEVYATGYKIAAGEP